LEAGRTKKPVISIVDDDDSVREGTMDLVRAMGFIAEAFQHAKDFLKSKRLPGTFCLISGLGEQPCGVL
jgi:FixJ family two-component response regulator